jgi:hypothetical protein
MAYNVYFSCDRCGETHNWVNHMIAYSTAVRIAREKGWQIGKRGWFCSFCKHKANRKKYTEENK